MEGSGGESHRRRLSRSWFPVDVSGCPERRRGKVRDDERLTSSNLSSMPCTSSWTSCTLLDISFTSPPMSCILLSTSSTFLPTSCTSPPTSCTLSSTPFTLSSTPFTLSPTPITFPSIPCAIFRSSADAIRASSCVNLSSSCSASGISVFPISFFKYFSGYMSAKKRKSTCDQLTPPSALHFLCRDPKDRYHLHHDLNNYFRHFRGR